MKHILITLIILLNVKALSQNTDNTFGVITPDQIEMSSYKLDHQADAVNLFDIGKSKFTESKGGYDIEFTRHKRIKIFEKSALKYAEISIPFFVGVSGKSEIIQSILATTYNVKDGQLTKTNVLPSAIHEETTSETWKRKIFVFPNVQAGSILEFEYTLITPFHFNLPDWTFQDRIPTIYSEYEVRMIPFYEYVFLVQGILRFDSQKSVTDTKDRSWGDVAIAQGRNVGSGVVFQDYIHTYILKDVPAFKDESYISSINDYIIKWTFNCQNSIALLVALKTLFQHGLN